MLYRKIEKRIRSHLANGSNKILIVEGARQIGKTYIIRYVGKSLFENYIEINLLEDSLNDRLFESVRSVDDFYLQLSAVAGDRMKDKDNTLVFLDEIQAYPALLTLLKFLKQDDRYTYIASGSLLGITLSQTPSIPMGSIELLPMYPLDFEEFLIANHVGTTVIDSMREHFLGRSALPEATHHKITDLFRKYLLTGGMPDAVNSFIADKNIMEIRRIQQDIHTFYEADASQYDRENRLKIRRIYDMIPSVLENKKKRIVIKDIENKKGKRYSDYQDEFDYLINAGIALEVRAISTPTFPLSENSGKNLLKLYLNDVGILTGILYQNNIRAIMDDVRSINLGTVYESVVAMELKAHGRSLYYYDNRHKGEVDFLIDDFDSLSVLPIEVKSGKDYKEHSAIDTFLKNDDYPVQEGIVLSNAPEVRSEGQITYMPIYNVMFM